MGKYLTNLGVTLALGAMALVSGCKDETSRMAKGGYQVIDSTGYQIKSATDTARVDGAMDVIKDAWIDLTRGRELPTGNSWYALDFRGLDHASKPAEYTHRLQSERVQGFNEAKDAAGDLWEDLQTKVEMALY